MGVSKVKCDCRNCERSTFHDVMSEAVESGDSDYHFTQRYQIVKCRGCETISFRKHFIDYENSFPISDDEWEYDESVECYPRISKKQIKNSYYIPKIVRSIYLETNTAIREGALTLASLGLRGTIEAICNDKKIEGKNLQSRITKLSSSGYVSKIDAENLHGIRFLGNDAAHEIKVPDKSQVDIALNIVNNIITSIYILSSDSKDSLDTEISDVSNLIHLIKKKIGDLNVGDELPLAAILGKDTRRIVSGISTIESSLIDEINNGGFSLLKLGKMDKYAGSKDDLQHYIVCEEVVIRRGRFGRRAEAPEAPEAPEA